MVWFNKGGGVPFRILIPMDTACFHTLITIVCKPIVSLDGGHYYLVWLQIICIQCNGSKQQTSSQDNKEFYYKWYVAHFIVVPFKEVHIFLGISGRCIWWWRDTGTAGKWPGYLKVKSVHVHFILQSSAVWLINKFLNVIFYCDIFCLWLKHNQGGRERVSWLFIVPSLHSW